MITLFKHGYEKILKLFYEYKYKKFHLREICRQTNLHEPSTTKFLNELEKIKILKSEKDANLKKYSMQKNNSSYLVYSYFDIQKFEKLPLIRKEAISKYIDTLKEKPIFVILFGSTAKGTYKETSDIDILIVSNKKIDVTNAEKEVDAITGMNISSFQITFKEFLKEIKLKDDKVIASALESGYPITNHIYYYEVLYNERI